MRLTVLTRRRVKAPGCKVSGNAVRELLDQGQHRGHEGFAHLPAWNTAARCGRRHWTLTTWGADEHFKSAIVRALQGVQHTLSDLAGGVGRTAAEVLVEEAVPLCPLAGLREATLFGVGLIAEALARDANQLLEAEGHDGAGEGGGHLGPWVCQPREGELTFSFNWKAGSTPRKEGTAGGRGRQASSVSKLAAPARSASSKPGSQFAEPTRGSPQFPTQPACSGWCQAWPQVAAGSASQAHEQPCPQAQGGSIRKPHNAESGSTSSQAASARSESTGKVRRQQRSHGKAAGMSASGYPQPGPKPKLGS